MVTLETSITVLSIVAISLILVNGLTIKFTLRLTELRKPTRLAILSLLLVHLFQGLIVAPSYAVDRSPLHSRIGVCEFFKFSHAYLHYVCSLNVLIFSLDRFCGVQYPLQYKSWVTKTRMSRLLIFIWVYVLILCLIPFVPHNTGHHCYYYQKSEWIFTMLVAHILIPLIITCICYVITFRKMITLAKRQKFQDLSLKGLLGNHRHSRNNSSSERYDKRIKKCKFTLMIVGVYILTWVPKLCYDLLLATCPLDCFPNNYFESHAAYDGSYKKEMIEFVITLFTLVDGLVSPIIYCSTEGKKSLVESLRQQFTKFPKTLPIEGDYRDTDVFADHKTNIENQEQALDCEEIDKSENILDYDPMEFRNGRETIL